jgi:hypothetical protein
MLAASAGTIGPPRTVSIPYSADACTPQRPAGAGKIAAKSLSALGFLDKFGLWRDDCLQWH